MLSGILVHFPSLQCWCASRSTSGQLHALCVHKACFLMTFVMYILCGHVRTHMMALYGNGKIERDYERHAGLRPSVAVASGTNSMANR